MSAARTHRIGPGRASHQGAQAVTQPIIVHSRADIAGLLRSHRMACGMSCEQFDAHAGFTSGYVTKLENGLQRADGAKHEGVFITPSPVSAGATPTIKVNFMGETWISALGLALVLMPAEQAEAIGAVKAEDKDPRNKAAR